MSLSSDVITRLSGKTIATAESLTGGGIGTALTSVSGSSAVYKGGVISYTNEIKMNVLGVAVDTLEKNGAVSAQVAEEMVHGVRKLMHTDVAVSVTGLAGPGGDEYGNPIGTVFIGYEDSERNISCQYLFAGSREDVRTQTIQAALDLILKFNE